jgi:hypothetical protein
MGKTYREGDQPKDEGQNDKKRAAHDSTSVHDVARNPIIYGAHREEREQDVRQADEGQHPRNNKDHSSNHAALLSVVPGKTDVGNRESNDANNDCDQEDNVDFRPDGRVGVNHPGGDIKQQEHKASKNEYETEQHNDEAKEQPLHASGIQPYLLPIAAYLQRPASL